MIIKYNLQNLKEGKSIVDIPFIYFSLFFCYLFLMFKDSFFCYILFRKLPLVILMVDMLLHNLLLFLFICKFLDFYRRISISGDKFGLTALEKCVVS